MSKKIKRIICCVCASLVLIVALCIPFASKSNTKVTNYASADIMQNTYYTSNNVTFFLPTWRLDAVSGFEQYGSGSFIMSFQFNDYSFKRFVVQSYSGSIDDGLGYQSSADTIGNAGVALNPSYWFPYSQINDNYAFYYRYNNNNGRSYYVLFDFEKSDKFLTNAYSSKVECIDSYTYNMLVNGVSYSFTWKSYVISFYDSYNNFVKFYLPCYDNFFYTETSPVFFALTGDESYNAGYYEGQSAGYSEGQSAGYNTGYTAGDSVGYNRGYNAGVDATNTYSFTNLISAVLDAPINAFTSLFNFEILGVNLSSFLLALFTICVVLTVIKFIF